MALILDNKKSQVGSPYGWYSVYAEEVSGSRTSSSVKIRFRVKWHLDNSASYINSGISLTAYLKIEGEEYSLTLKKSDSSISGSSNRYAPALDSDGDVTWKTVTISGLSATQTSLTGIKFRVDTNYTGGDLDGAAINDPVSCSSISIASGNGPSTFTLSDTTCYIGGSSVDTLTVSSVKEIVSSNDYRFWMYAENSSGTKTETFVSSLNSRECSFSASSFGWCFGKSSTTVTKTLYLRTYNSSGSQVGSSQGKDITLKMSSSVGAPTGLALTHKSTSKGKVVFTITPPTCKYGATLSSYSCDSNIGTVSRDGTTVTVSIPAAASSSSLTLTVTAKDTRGFTDTASKTVTYNGVSSMTLSGSTFKIGDTFDTTISEWVASNTVKMSMYSSSNSSNSYEWSDMYSGSEDQFSLSASRIADWFGSSSTSLKITVKATTYNSAGSSLGSTTKEITVTMPSSTGAPTGLALTHKSTSKGSVVFTITPPTYKYGASLSKYNVISNMGTVSRSGTTLTISIPEGASSSSLTVGITAIDTRGFSSNTASRTVTYNGVSSFTLNRTSAVLELEKEDEEPVIATFSEWVASNKTKFKYTSGSNSYELDDFYLTNNPVEFNTYASRFGNWFSPSSTSLTVTLNATTYNSAETALGTSSKSFTITMPERIGAPTNLKVEKKGNTETSMTFAITPPACKYGATISSYDIATTVGTAARNGNTITVTHAENAALENFMLTVTAIDSRGFRSNTVKIKLVEDNTDICCYIDDLWTRVVPYVYMNGAWVKCVKYLYINGQWDRGSNISKVTLLDSFGRILQDSNGAILIVEGR